MVRFDNDTATSHPLLTDLEAGTYYWCQCGKTKSVPFCDGSHGDSGIEPVAFEIAAARSVAICNCGLTKSGPYCDGSHLEIE